MGNKYGTKLVARNALSSSSRVVVLVDSDVFIIVVFSAAQPWD
jgi:hypothetical protein